MLQGAGLPWAGVAAGTWMACGAAFFLGLRVFRRVYSRTQVLPSVAASTATNFRHDAALSVSIGGATGAFVGTDVVYLPEQNPLIDAFGVEATDAPLVGCVKAGASTAFGFTAAQSLQNVVTQGRTWTDL